MHCWLTRLYIRNYMQENKMDEGKNNRSVLLYILTVVKQLYR